MRRAVARSCVGSASEARSGDAQRSDGQTAEGRQTAVGGRLTKFIMAFRRRRKTWARKRSTLAKRVARLERNCPKPLIMEASYPYTGTLNAAAIKSVKINADAGFDDFPRVKLLTCTIEGASGSKYADAYLILDDPINTAGPVYGDFNPAIGAGLDYDDTYGERSVVKHYLSRGDSDVFKIYKRWPKGIKFETNTNALSSGGNINRNLFFILKNDTGAQITYSFCVKIRYTYTRAEGT